MRDLVVVLLSAAALGAGLLGCSAGHVREDAGPELLPEAGSGPPPMPEDASEPADAPAAPPLEDAGVWPGDAAAPAPDAAPTAPDAGPPSPRDLALSAVSGHGLPGCYRCGLGAGDFDADGFIDVVMVGAFDRAWTAGMASYTFDNRVRVYRNTSGGGMISFALAAEPDDVRGGGGASVVTGDFDGDGRTDFAVQLREGVSPDSDTSAFLSDGGMQFRREILAPGFDTNSTSLGMAAADVDRDGRDDLLFISDGQTFGPGLWYSRTATMGWAPRQTGFSHKIAYGGAVAAGDLDGDGYPDLVVGGNSVFPFGTYDCSQNRIYGEIHFNAGAAAPGIRGDGLDLGRFAMRADRANPRPCTGMDNAGLHVTDVDLDGNLDLIIAGSADGFEGPPGLNGVHYDFVVLRNVDGSGANYVAFEVAGTQHPLGTTNAGSGNVDSPNIASGDLDGDGYPEIFVQGHHRDYERDAASYVFDSRLFTSVRGEVFVELDLGLPDVGEGGQLIADLDNDGWLDLVFSGALLPFHSNGANPFDLNDPSTLVTYVYRNRSGAAP